MSAQLDLLIAQLRQQRVSSKAEPVIAIYDTLIAALAYLDSGAGAVSSVGLALDAGLYTVSGSPVTGAGTLTGTLDTQIANRVFAGPAAAGPSKPTFRALVAADIPSLSGVYLPLAGGTMAGAINAQIIQPSADVTFTLGGPVNRWSSIYGVFLSDGVQATRELIGSSGTVARVANGSDWTAINLPKAVTLSSTITPNQTAGIVGTTTNNDAQAGSVGEAPSATVPAGSAAALSSNTTANVTSISLSAGDYQVYGTVSYTPAGLTASEFLAFISDVSATLATAPNDGSFNRLPISVVGQSSGISMLAGQKRFSLSATTTIYLETRVVFTVGTISAYGTIAARRMR